MHEGQVVAELVLAVALAFPTLRDTTEAQQGQAGVVISPGKCCWPRVGRWDAVITRSSDEERAWRWWPRLCGRSIKCQFGALICPKTLRVLYFVLCGVSRQVWREPWAPLASRGCEAPPSLSQNGLWER